MAMSDSVRSLRCPRDISVEAVDANLPTAVTTDGVKLRVVDVRDRWRIDDEWWREERVSRTYFQLLMQNGQSIIMFHDDVNGTWYWQRYG